MNTQAYINLIENHSLRKSCKTILDTLDFFTHPASTGPHHAYIGGLAVHTEEVLDYAIKLAKSFPQADLDVLIAAGLWHDYGKIWDYKLVTFFRDQYGEIPKYCVLAEDHGDYKKVYISDPEYKNQLHHTERRAVREEYIKLQNGNCYLCGESLDKEPKKTKRITKHLYPENFFKYPVHLHHCHDSGMTIGAVHCYCNAVLWEYHGE